METEYRIALPDDRPQWIALREELWPDCPGERHELETEQILESEGLIVVADYRGELVGFAEVSIRVDHVEGTRSSPVPYLEGWYVETRHRGKGVGRALLESIERWAVARGFEEIASDAAVDNLRSVRLHTELGFTEAGRSVHFVKRLRARDGSSRA